jgi:hypothetical protein
MQLSQFPNDETLNTRHANDSNDSNDSNDWHFHLGRPHLQTQTLS